MDNAKPTVKIRTEVVSKARITRSLETDTALADRMGIARSNLSRCLRDRQSPSPKFIAALCVALELSMNELFVIVQPDEGERAA